MINDFIMSKLMAITVLMVAVFFAGCAGMVPTPPPQAPLPLEPKSNVSGGETVYTLQPVLQWQTVPGAEGYAIYVNEQTPRDYRLIYSTKDRGQPQLHATSFRLPPNLLRDGGHYRWNVRAWNSSGWSPYSRSYEFRVKIYADRELESVVRDHLQRAPEVDDRNIRIIARDGDITLSGCLNTRRQIDLANEVTASVGGVHRVYNDLRVCR
ncbi:BON domain-containing protein [Desulfoferula mesophila]|uniref:BON domain-containing protein n=1 Tax=Desulfoferula mesophila TaxID=3058419 RepID=A0AAU9EIR6_9BACT|nr:hypothetical protein FAK_09370 [Desulfoferula mesophilus]